MSEKETSTPREEEPTVKRALLFMYWVAALLGSDYVFTLSSGPNYFTRIDTGGAFDMRDSDPTKAANTHSRTLEYLYINF